MKRATAIHCSSIVLFLGICQFALANEFDVSVRASSEHENSDNACALAFELAEQEAMAQLGEHFSTPQQTNFSSQLIKENETQTARENKTVCVFEGIWRGIPETTMATLIGSEQFIDGQYSGSCLDSSNGDICWQRIVRQAEADLYLKLERQGPMPYNVGLAYTDFEGRQRDQYQQKRLEMTADGRFYFKVIERTERTDDTYISITRSDRITEKYQDPKTTPSEQPMPIKDKPKKEKEYDKVDITLFYTWDGNDSALQNDLAISSDRWGVGLWANNRIGFAAFRGSDKIGIADENQRVVNASGSYETTGVGMGFRLWNTRAVTVENMIYYVDAQPYRTLVAPDCDTCTDQTFRADNYLQATVNLKTNSHGINVGWMMTWKLMDPQPNLDTLSSGFYLELQL